MIASSE